VRLHRRLERYLKRTGISASRLGREAAGDPRFVYDLREGRRLGAEMQERVHAWLDANSGKRAANKCKR
jgi:hypothetical protein